MISDQMTPTDFRQWMERLDLNQRRAARLLGVDKSTVQRYRSGAITINRRTWIVCKQSEMLYNQRKAEKDEQIS